MLSSCWWTRKNVLAEGWEEALRSALRRMESQQVGVQNGIDVHPELSVSTSNCRRTVPTTACAKVNKSTIGCNSRIEIASIQRGGNHLLS
mmetsp:Transcript_19428/g.58668  ORF Transcript_19428/g.58668 Transcript_19428/m.58668 type:complete len:90 (+) Transcript_19428:1028-1297(+)|eukprot:scaffold54096_cov33-Tisochrysis_lutea.AAC.5